MAQFHPAFSRESLQDKVIVLTGMSTEFRIVRNAPLIPNRRRQRDRKKSRGTMRSTVQHGAYVFFGDIDEKAGRDVQDAVNQGQESPRAKFVAVDVTNYQSVLSLFKTALSLHGRIDHVIANAGIMERGNWFDPALTVESVEEVRNITPNMPIYQVSQKWSDTPYHSSRRQPSRLSILRAYSKRLSTPEQNQR